MQSADDLMRAGMGGDYFPRLYNWIRSGGAAAVTHWLQSYRIPAEFDPMELAHRAPKTSSMDEAVIQSRGRVEQAIAGAVDEQLPGFRNGWISSSMANELMKSERINITPQKLSAIIQAMGYHQVGRYFTAILQENLRQPNLYNRDKKANIATYPKDQGYN